MRLHGVGDRLGIRNLEDLLAREAELLRGGERALAVIDAAAGEHLLVKQIELQRRGELRQRKLDAPRLDRRNAEHRERHQHEVELLVGREHRAQVDRGLAAIGTVQVVELVDRDVALRVADGRHMRELSDLVAGRKRDHVVHHRRAVEADDLV